MAKSSTPSGSPEPVSSGSAHRLFAIRVLTYVTNHVVAHVPSFAELFRAGFVKTWFMASHQHSIQRPAVVVPVKHRAAVPVTKM